ncbi:MAG TPA: hypothetical protein VGM82_13220 [Gemmatimonadaceae bacterium]|jgi:hypothetical protein
MSDDAAEAATLTTLIAAHDVAMQVVTDIDADEIAVSGALAEGSIDAPRSPVRRKTTSGMLLELAAATLGLERLAGTLEIPADALARFLGDSKTMTLAQQRSLALSVLLLCDGRDDLRRKATTLLGQVNAAADFEAGVTPRHASPPPSNLGWT